MAFCRTFQDADTWLGGKADRPTGQRGTRIHRLDADTIAVRYHQTDVVTYSRDGATTLRTGGYWTLTTKSRIKEYTGWHIWSENGIWFLDTGDGSVVFSDGMRLNDRGEPTTPVTSREMITQTNNRLRRDIRRYVQGFADHVRTNKCLDAPDGGDCWGCYFQAAPDNPHLARPTTAGWTYRTQRVEPMGVDHYLSHFEEQYYVPSLVWNAIKGCNYRDPQFIWSAISARAQSGDVQMLRRVLSSFFRQLRPRLLKERMREAQAA